MTWWWRRTPSQEEARRLEEVDDGLCKTLKPWFLLCMLFLMACVYLRWSLGDAHGALLMFCVTSVGILSVQCGRSGAIDPLCGGYFAILAFVSGILDMNLVIQHIMMVEWRQFRHQQPSKEDYTGFLRVAMYLLCAAGQLTASFMGYLAYMDEEIRQDALEGYDSSPFLVSAEEQRVYGAVLSYSQRGDHGGVSTRLQHGAMGDLTKKPFVGVAHKLPC